MKIRWEYPLYTDGQCDSYDYEGPMYIQGKYLYFVTRMPRLLLHIIDAETGEKVRIYDPAPDDSILASDCFFLPFGEDVLLWCRTLVRIRDGEVLRELRFPGRGGLKSHLVLGDRLYLVFRGQNAALVCVDMEKLHILWEVDLRSKPYSPGPVTAIADRLACFGQNTLLFLDPDTGAVLETLKLPRVGKLFQPTDLGNGRMLLGYTNWSNAGVLCMDTASKKVLWRHKRNFEGPQLRCRYWLDGDRAFWVKNDTELCCVSLADGAELYRLRTEPWLYSEPELAAEGLVFGTSGGDGFLRCLDPETGLDRWSIPMKGGCLYYARRDGSIFAGDYENRLMEIRAADGAILQTLDTAAEVVGRINCAEGSVYTVLWGDDTLPCRLIRVQI